MKNNIIPNIVLIVVIIAIATMFITGIFNPREVKFPDFNPIINISTDSLSKTKITQEFDSVIIDFKETQKEIALTKDSFLSISHLNGFYATLIAFITLLAVLFGFLGWRKINRIEEDALKYKREIKEREVEMQEIFIEYKKIKNDQDELKKKKGLANWVQSKINENRKYILSTNLKISVEDESKLEDIDKLIQDDNEDDCWLQLIYAKQKMNGSTHKSCTCNKSSENSFFASENNHCSCYTRYHESYEVYSDINNKMVRIKDGAQKSTFFHMFGQLFWDYYNHTKNKFYEQNNNGQDNFKELLKEWVNKGDVVDIETQKSECYPEVILNKALLFYEKSIKIISDKEESLGSYAVVLTELAKLVKNKEPEKEPEKTPLSYVELLLKAKNVLDKIFDMDDKADENTYWDLSRILFYLDGEKNKQEVERLLYKAANRIAEKNDMKSKNNFIKELNKDFSETGYLYEKTFIEDVRKIICGYGDKEDRDSLIERINNVY